MASSSWPPKTTAGICPHGWVTGPWVSIVMLALAALVGAAALARNHSSTELLLLLPALLVVLTLLARMLSAFRATPSNAPGSTLTQAPDLPEVWAP